MIYKDYFITFPVRNVFRLMETTPPFPQLLNYCLSRQIFVAEWAITIGHVGADIYIRPHKYTLRPRFRILGENKT